MDWTHHVRSRLREITGDAAVDSDIVEELADDLAQRYDTARARGLTDAEAQTDVLKEFADTDKFVAHLRRERPVRRRPVPPVSQPRAGVMADVGQDVRYALRVLAASPGFTATAVLTLAIGLGGITAIASVVNAVLLAPVPYSDPSRLVALWETDSKSSTVREPGSVPDLIDLRQRCTTIDRIGGAIADEVTLTATGAEPMRVAALDVTDTLLELLGARPMLGRGFTDAEYTTGAGSPVLISERLWRSRLGADPAAIGRMLRLDDSPHVIVGVLPDAADVGVLQWLLAADYSRGFADRDARSRVDVWMPLVLDADALPRDTHPVLLLGHLAPGAGHDAAQSETSSVMSALEHAYPENRARGAHLEPFLDVVFGPVRPALGSLLVAVVLVLLLAAANVANLVLVRGTRRLREVAVRTALGATLPRLTRQFVIETALLVGAATAIALALAVAATHVLASWAPPDIPRLAGAVLDVRLFALTAIVAAALAIGLSVMPVLQARRLDLAPALATEQGRGATAGGRHGTTRSVLIVVEVALALALAAGAAVMIRSVWRLSSVDPGFQAAGVLKAEFQLPASRYPRSLKAWPNFVEMHVFNQALLEKVRALPGVESVALAGNHPLDAGFTNSFRVVGREEEGRDWPEIALRRVTPAYWRVVGVPLVRGRLFRDGDASTAAPVVLVNEAAAGRFFAGRDPLGQQIAFWGQSRTIVGVVGNERFHGVTEAPPPAVFAPLAQTPSLSGSEVLLVRTRDAASQGAAALHAAVASLDPGLALFGVEPLQATLDASFGKRRFVMLLLSLFAGIALLLAAIGMHAVLSYDVAARTREIGIRMALGARPAAVVLMVVGRGAMLALAGLCVGALGAFGISRLLTTLVFGVHPSDPVSIVGAMATLLVTLLGISVLPAWRAVQKDPSLTLREE